MSCVYWMRISGIRERQRAMLHIARAETDDNLQLVIVASHVNERAAVYML